jgi:hypothetical protein
MALTQYALDQALRFLFTAAAIIRPVNFYLAWHDGLPGDDGSLGELNVGKDADYARQPITFSTSEWSATTKKQLTSNTNTVSIAPAAATSYTIYGFSVWDSLTGGNCLVSGNAKYPISVSDVDPKDLVAGKIPVTLSRRDGFGRVSHGAGLFLDWLLTTNSVARPTVWYTSLHTADPGDNGSANEVTAGDDPDYARQATAFNTPGVTPGGDTYTRNNIASIWIPGTGTNLEVTHAAIWDAASLGNALVTAALSPARQAIESQTFSIAAKDITIIETK